MRDRGLKVWLDEWELVPGRPWQEAIEEIITTVLSSAVLVGKDGLGPWEIPEMRACLSQMVKRKLPVIPVLLPGCPQAPELPIFLGEVTWVDLRDGLTEEGLDRIEWGITGKKPRRKKKPQSLGPKIPPKLHNLPFLPLGDLFKGRDDALRTLEANLHGSTAATAITQTTIYGLGGIGKTRLAVEYAWRSGDRYDTALFVVAESPEALRSGLASLISIGLPGLDPSPTRSQEEEVAAVHSWLRKYDRWLLILDNVDSEEAAEAARKILPRLQGGHVLITSRRRNWPAGIRKLPLDELSLEEATGFLLQRTDELRAPAMDDPKRARQLAEILDGLPIALEQAAAYIAYHQMKFSEYLEIWEREKESVLDWHDGSQMDYPASVAATWQATFRQLSPTAAAILRLTAYLAPDPIPSDMFESGADLIEEGVKLLSEEIGQEAGPKPVREGIAELAAYSMVTREAGFFSVHRMVQEVLGARIPEDRRREWIERALRLVNNFSPPEPEDVRTWPVWNLLMPHVAVVTNSAKSVGILNPTARLMGELAFLLYGKSRYIEAEGLMRQALEMGEESLGLASPVIALLLNNLAQLLQVTNRLSEAEASMLRALKIDEDFFGTDHPTVAIRLNNLAGLLRETYRLEEAEPLMLRAIDILEASLGPNHHKVGTALSNLAALLRDNNRVEDAEQLMLRALRIDEDSLGINHPNVAEDLGNLAMLLQDTNRLADAEQLLRRALKIDEEAFGFDHPKVASNLSRLGSLLQDRNQLAEAELLMRRALKLGEESLGPGHPNVGLRLNNLASLLHGMKRSAEAEPLMRRAVEIFEASLGTDHPNSRIVRGNLEILLAAMNPEEPQQP